MVEVINHGSRLSRERIMIGGDLKDQENVEGPGGWGKVKELVLCK